MNIIKARDGTTKTTFIAGQDHLDLDEEALRDLEKSERLLAKLRKVIEKKKERKKEKKKLKKR